jgi:hypothetical protein
MISDGIEGGQRVGAPHSASIAEPPPHFPAVVPSFDITSERRGRNPNPPPPLWRVPKHISDFDLPKEVRLTIYERLPRRIQRHEMGIYSWRNKEIPHQRLTIILRTVSTAMLSACRQINSEASPVVHGIARRFILLQVSKHIDEYLVVSATRLIALMAVSFSSW